MLGHDSRRRCTPDRPQIGPKMAQSTGETGISSTHKFNQKSSVFFTPFTFVFSTRIMQFVPISFWTDESCSSGWDDDTYRPGSASPPRACESLSGPCLFEGRRATGPATDLLRTAPRSDPDPGPARGPAGQPTRATSQAPPSTEYASQLRYRLDRTSDQGGIATRLQMQGGRYCNSLAIAVPSQLQPGCNSKRVAEGHFGRRTHPPPAAKPTVGRGTQSELDLILSCQEHLTQS